MTRPALLLTLALFTGCLLASWAAAEVPPHRLVTVKPTAIEPHRFKVGSDEYGVKVGDSGLRITYKLKVPANWTPPNIATLHLKATGDWRIVNAIGEPKFTDELLTAIYDDTDRKIPGWNGWTMAVLARAKAGDSLTVHVLLHGGNGEPRVEAKFWEAGQ